MKKELTFKYNARDNDYQHRARYHFLCGEVLHEYFTFPIDAASIVIKLSSRPSKHSYRVSTYKADKFLISVGMTQVVTGSWAADQLLRFGFPCYVSLKY